LFTGLVVSCQTVKIHNARIYGDEGVLGAAYVETQTNISGDIGQPEWDNMRFGMLCMDSDDFINFKSEIEELCHLNQSACTYEFQEQIKILFTKLDQMKSHIRSSNGHTTKKN